MSRPSPRAPNRFDDQSLPEEKAQALRESRTRIRIEMKENRRVGHRHRP
jgi:hypothetical protein